MKVFTDRLNKIINVILLHYVVYDYFSPVHLFQPMPRMKSVQFASFQFGLKALSVKSLCAYFLRLILIQVDVPIFGGLRTILNKMRKFDNIKCLATIDDFDAS